jgi:integrase
MDTTERTRTLRKAKGIGEKDVDALKPNQVMWDGLVTGFGIRRQKDKVSYFIKYRFGGKQFWHTIGRENQFTVVEARARARDITQKLYDGVDPRHKKPREMTVSELCDQYMDYAARLPLRRIGRPKKQTTLRTDVSRIESHIRPMLGDYGVSAVNSRLVEKFMVDVAEGRTKSPRAVGGEGTATRTVWLLSAIFSYAVKEGLCSDNPVRAVNKFAPKRKERRLSDDEYGVLGNAVRLAAQSTVWPPAVAAIKFLVVSGWRRGEVLGLRWSELDIGRRTAHLVEDEKIRRTLKTRRSMRPLSKVAIGILKAMRQYELLGNGWVFPSANGGGRVKTP